MSAGPRLWPALLVPILLILLTLGTFYITHSLWLTIFVAVLTFLGTIWITSSFLRSTRDISVVSELSKMQPSGDNAIARKLLVELLLAGQEKKSVVFRVQDLIRENLRLNKFVIFFREDDKYIPKVYAGFNRNALATPMAHKLSSNLKNAINKGALSSADNDIRLALKSDLDYSMAAPVSFAYSWGRYRSVLVVADDPQGDFSLLAQDPGFNRVFWPGLEQNLRNSQKMLDNGFEIRQLDQQLGQAKKDITELNKNLRNKLLDIQSFVKVSNELYSLFNEGQLFQTLKSMVQSELGAGIAEILVPTGEGKFSIKMSDNSDQSLKRLVLEDNSELCELIMKSNRPVTLPLVGSGLAKNEPFLPEAFSMGFVMASAIRTGGKTSCILLVGEKRDGSHYSNQDLDFLFVISNIASLALDNIYQYSTIEKLSYTDSMTGVHNYRYFYKRLNEEVLRAKRYEREIALVILDIDNFKSFNDNYGHQAGDLVLKQLSDLITRTIRSIDVVSRYGGEEFCIIMPDTGVGNCTVFIERLRSQIAEFQFESDLFPKGSSISVSVGGAVFPHHAPTPDRLIYCSDMALLKAKSLGRNRAMIYEPDFSLDAHPVKGGVNESRQKSIF
jgi:diguanylate cyclase (GGDEF)-like protein